jgi:hypothetical protein
MISLHTLFPQILSPQLQQQQANLMLQRQQLTGSSLQNLVGGGVRV